MRNWILKIVDRVWYTPFSYRDPKGIKRICRLAPDKMAAFYDDPMTAAYGVDTSEFVYDWRKKDIGLGCPYCRAEVLENASEPDVMQRWGFRR